MFKCACEETCLDKYNTLEIRYMEVAMWQFRISMNFYMKLYFEQIFQVYKFCLGLVLL